MTVSTARPQPLDLAQLERYQAEFPWKDWDATKMKQLLDECKRLSAELAVAKEYAKLESDRSTIFQQINGDKNTEIDNLKREIRVLTDKLTHLQGKGDTHVR